MSYPENLDSKNETYYRSESIRIVKGYSPYGDSIDLVDKGRGELLEESIHQVQLTAHVRGRESALTRQVLLVNIMCTIEQWGIIAATVWLVGWQGWSAWWFLGALFLVESSSPSKVLKGLGIRPGNET